METGINSPVQPVAPAAGPKVIDLSGNNQPPQAGGFFHRRAFLFGVIGVILLAVGVGVGWYAVRQRTTTAPRATTCYGIRSQSLNTGPSGQGTESFVHLQAYNDCNTPVNVLIFRGWCLGDEYKNKQYGPCGSAMSNNSKDVLYPHSGKSYDIKTPVGNNGVCGSSQTDVTVTTGDKWNSTDPGGASFAYTSACEHTCKNNACQVTPQVGPMDCRSDTDCAPEALKCSSVALGGGAAVVKTASETRTLTASAKGGSGGNSFSWKATADAGDVGTFSSGQGKTVTWTAPATLTTAQTWTITATVKDSKGKTDSSGCVQTLTFTPTTTPPTFTFKTCVDNACVSKDCVPATTDCSASSTCSSDSDCVQPTHKTCQDNACVTVSGAGDNGCSVDGDCVPATHKECRNNSCQTVSGAGQSTCTMDSDCAPAQPQTHKECRNNACTSVSGAGNDTCNVDSECVTAAATHRACQNNSCVTVSGAGTDTCTSDVSCQPAATPPPIPQSGNELFTIGGLVLGAGSLLVGLLLIL